LLPDVPPLFAVDDLVGINILPQWKYV
jgi:hypothetical protein